ncbi:MAG: carbamate kinase [Actinomycetota bacterium]
MRIVVALGGNAILHRGERGTISEQRAVIREACEDLARLVVAGHQLVLTHGNGPQVGRLLVQNEVLPGQFPPLPLDVLVAETQGQLGYLIQQELVAALRRAWVPRCVVTVVTQSVVDVADPAMDHPSKPVGPHLTDSAARDLRARGHAVGAVSGGGWRRLVASPEPYAIVEEDALRALLERDVIPIAAGGGGIPVVREGNAYRGISAVVDKDLSAAVLVRAARADLLLVLTDVERVVRGFGTPDARPIDRLTIVDARAGLASGEFPPGSMGPKVSAAVQVVTAGGRAIIASLSQVEDALAGRAGTEIVA